MILDDIREGKCQVYYEGWNFVGGRDWGDSQNFTIQNGNEVVGYIEDNNVHGITIRTNEFVTFEGTDENYDEVRKVIYDAYKRDDKEIYNIVGDELPCDYEDISREDILEGRYE